MTDVVDIQFGEWLPDRPSLKNPGCEVADNVLPTPGGYGPLLGPMESGDTISGACKGAMQMFDNAGNSLIVGGTDDALFTRRSAVVETSGMTSIGAGEAWDFCQFNAFVIATGANNDPQYLSDIGTDDTWSGLTGSPPKAKRCAKVSDFLMLGNIDGAPNRIQWSAFNNPAGSWAASRLTQAGLADLPMEYGEVQRIVGGRYAMVFQRRGITRLSYVGPPVVFRADPVSQDRGALAPFGVMTVGYLTYFLAQDGFYVTNGSAVEPIGTQRVNRWFFENVNQARAAETQGAIDWQNECIVWAFYSQSDDQFDRMLIYSLSEGRWSSATLGVGRLVMATPDATTLTDLDSIYGNLDAIPMSLDSAEFAPADLRLAGFIGEDFVTFTGAPLRAMWETGEFQPQPGRRVHVTELAPLIAADDWDCEFSLMAKDHRGGRTTTPLMATGWGGFAPVRGEGQAMAVRMVKPSGVWSEAQGLSARFRVAGTR